MYGICRRAVISLSVPATSWLKSALSITHGPAIRKKGCAPPTSCPVSCIAGVAPSGARRLWQERGAVGARGADEAGEERVPVPWRGGELRVELRRDEPGVLGQLDHLHQPIAR